LTGLLGKFQFHFGLSRSAISKVC